MKKGPSPKQRRLEFDVRSPTSQKARHDPIVRESEPLGAYRTKLIWGVPKPKVGSPEPLRFCQSLDYIGKGHILSENLGARAIPFRGLSKTKFIETARRTLDLGIGLGNNSIVVCRKRAVPEKK
jgi:hypothetical protein